MEETSTRPATILQFRQDIEAQFRRHIRAALEVSLAEELAAALGSERHARPRFSTDGPSPTAASRPCGSAGY